MRARVALLALAVTGIGLVTSPGLATPRCTKTCRQETTGCARTRCATLRRKAREGCLNTCRGIGGCAHIRTFAYVLSECTLSGFHQRLLIRHGDCDPVTVLDFPEPLDVPPPCALIGSLRLGFASSPIVGAFHRMGVSSDGRHVVFEVTDDFTLLRDLRGAKANLVPPQQQEGIFIVGSDGRGLRRLGPASRNRSFRFAVDPASPIGVRGSAWIPFSFSPDGRAIVLADLGPGPVGEEAIQIFTLDLVTGSRTQLTHLPVVADPAVGRIALFAGTGAPVFWADGRISFKSVGNLDGSNQEGSGVEWVINRDGSGLKRVPLPVALPGSRVVSTFGIVGASGARRRADLLAIPGIPANASTGDTISEVFFFDGKDVLQLTKFHRADTNAPNRTPDGQRVIFAASADPFGTNPSGTCQLFSIGTLGVGLRQLTHFSQPEYSMNGCQAFLPPGCSILPYGLDPATGTLVFSSSCDPFGTNPYGDQLFAIRADGTHLRQLTHALGRRKEPDGTVSTENVGPIGYSFIRGR
jgi:hypothetical protein